MSSDGLVALGAKNSWGGGPRALYRMGRDGSDLTTLATYESSAEPQFDRVAVDGAWVYFSKRSGLKSTARDSLMRVPLAGGAVEVLVERFGSLGAVYEGHAYGLARDYWGARDEAIVRVPLSGGDVATLYRRPLRPVSRHGATFRFESLAVNADGVYVSDGGEERIIRLPHSGGAPEVLVSDLLLPGQLFPVGSFLFFRHGVGEESLAVVPKDGGKPKAPGCSEPWAVTRDADNLYVFGRGAEWVPSLFVMQEGGARSKRTRPAHIFMVTAVADDDCLYYARVDPSGVSWFDAVAKPSL